jgi:hypothetical protein
MEHEIIIDTAWLFLKFAHEEWNLLVPELPQFEVTPAQLEMYRGIKQKMAERRKKTLQLAELQKRLDLLMIHEDTAGVNEVIFAYQKTIEEFRRRKK